MQNQYVVSVSDVLDLRNVDEFEDVFIDASSAQSEASHRAFEDGSERTYYVHEVTSTPVFNAKAVKTVTTEVM